MSIRFQCDHCKRHVKVESRHAGKQSKCPSCQGVLTIPYPDQIETASHDSADDFHDAGQNESDEFDFLVSDPPAGGQEASATGPAPPRFDPSDASGEENPYQSPQSRDLWDGPADGLDGSGNPVRYAGFWLRFCAAFVDGFITNILVGIVGLVMGLSFSMLGHDMVQAIVPLAQFSGIIIQWLYFALMESSTNQATLGKMSVGIRVTDLDGRRLSFGQATGRYFGKILSGLILGIGFLMAAFTEKKQALHDMLAGTLVVRK